MEAGIAKERAARRLRFQNRFPPAPPVVESAWDYAWESRRLPDSVKRRGCQAKHEPPREKRIEKDARRACQLASFVVV